MNYFIHAVAFSFGIYFGVRWASGLCWHRWGRWHLACSFEYQKRSCDKCGKTQLRSTL